MIFQSLSLFSGTGNGRSLRPQRAWVILKTRGRGLLQGPIGEGIREATNRLRDSDSTNEGTENQGSKDLSNGGLKD